MMPTVYVSPASAESSAASLPPQAVNAIAATIIVAVIFIHFFIRISPFFLSFPFRVLLYYMHAYPRHTVKVIIALKSSMSSIILPFLQVFCIPVSTVRAQKKDTSYRVSFLFFLFSNQPSKARSFANSLPLATVN